LVRTYDCIIAGAGPAGSTALRQLALLGVKAVAVDKAVFPRHKPCGGAISALTSRELDFDWRDLVEASLHTVELAHKYSHPLLCKSDQPFAHFVMRERFDYRLLEKAVEAGGEFLPGHAVTGVEREEDGWVIVHTTRGDLKARVVIGADGANGEVAHSAGLFNFERGIAIEAEVEPTDELARAYRDKVYLSYADPPWGYGWIFPKSGRLSVGVGTFSRRRGAIKDAFERFLEQTGLAGLPMQVYGHPIPTGGTRRRIWKDRILLVGDAAGLNDPLSGEGIAHAVLSGKIAAKHVADALDRGEFDFSGYQVEIDERIVSELARAAWIAEKLYTFPRLFFWLFEKSPETLALYFRLVRGEISYADLIDHLAGQFVRFNLFREERGGRAASQKPY